MVGNTNEGRMLISLLLFASTSPNIFLCYCLPVSIFQRSNISCYSAYFNNIKSNITFFRMYVFSVCMVNTNMDS